MLIRWRNVGTAIPKIHRYGDAMMMGIRCVMHVDCSKYRRVLPKFRHDSVASEYLTLMEFINSSLKLHHSHRPLSLKSDVVRKRHRMGLAEYATPVDGEAVESPPPDADAPKPQSRPRKKLKAESVGYSASFTSGNVSTVNVTLSPVIHPQQYYQQPQQHIPQHQQQLVPQHVTIPILTSLPTAPPPYQIIAAPPLHTFRLQHPTYSNPALQHFQEKR